MQMTGLQQQQLQQFLQSLGSQRTPLGYDPVQLQQMNQIQQSLQLNSLQGGVNSSLAGINLRNLGQLSLPTTPNHAQSLGNFQYNGHIGQGETPERRHNDQSISLKVEKDGQNAATATKTGQIRSGLSTPGKGITKNGDRGMFTQTQLEQLHRGNMASLKGIGKMNNLSQVENGEEQNDVEENQSSMNNEEQRGNSTNFNAMMQMGLSPLESLSAQAMRMMANQHQIGNSHFATPMSHPLSASFAHNSQQSQWPNFSTQGDNSILATPRSVKQSSQQRKTNRAVKTVKEDCDESYTNEHHDETDMLGTYSNQQVSGMNSVVSDIEGETCDEKEERIRKRRSQIAAASRKSRAKRKKELVTLREENEKLWTEVVTLKKKLREADNLKSQNLQVVDENASQRENNNSKDTSKTSEQDKTYGPLKKRRKENGIISRISNGIPGMNIAQSHVERSVNSIDKNVPKELHANVFQGKRNHSGNFSENGQSVDSELNDNATSGDPCDYYESKRNNDFDYNDQLRNLLKFFNSRLSNYFTQLKSDTITHFASELPFASKQILANLEIKLLVPSLLPPLVKSNLGENEDQGLNLRNKDHPNQPNPGMNSTSTSFQSQKAVHAAETLKVVEPTFEEEAAEEQEPTNDIKYSDDQE